MGLEVLKSPAVVYDQVALGAVSHLETPPHVAAI
jgi:hypothetical protein